MILFFCLRFLLRFRFLALLALGRWFHLDRFEELNGGFLHIAELVCVPRVRQVPPLRIGFSQERLLVVNELVDLLLRLDR